MIAIPAAIERIGRFTARYACRTEFVAVIIEDKKTELPSNVKRGAAISTASGAYGKIRERIGRANAVIPSEAGKAKKAVKR